MSVSAGMYGLYLNQPDETLVICSLKNTKPFYNCDEVWTLHLYRGDAYKNCSLYHSDSCAKWWNIPNAKVAYINIDNKWEDPNPRNGQWGKSLLAHELEHLKCRCSWHG